MSAIEYYYMPESPPCRAVEMVLSLVGAKVNKHYINLFTRENHQPEFSEINPLHKIPFIVDGKLRIGESRAIMSYLVDKYLPGGSPLYPKDLVQRSRVNELLYFDMSFYQTQSKLLLPKLFGPVEELDAEAEKAYRTVLEYMNNRLKNNGGKQYLLGDDLTLADITFAATLSFAEACDYDLSEFKNLLDYYNGLKKTIPHYSEINDKAFENMRNYIKSKQKS